MPTQGRPPCLKVTPGVSAQIGLALDAHVAPPLESVARYGKLRMRRRPRWQEVYRNRSVVADLFAASGGYQLPQKGFEKIAVQWGDRKDNFVSDFES